MRRCAAPFLQQGREQRKHPPGKQKATHGNARRSLRYVRAKQRPEQRCGHAENTELKKQAPRQRLLFNMHGKSAEHRAKIEQKIDALRRIGGMPQSPAR